MSMTSSGSSGGGGTPSQNDTKAYLLTETGDQIPCMFNPENFSLSMQNSWKNNTLPGQGVGEASFMGSSPGTLSLTLFFDTTATGADVTTYTNKLQKLMEIDPDISGSDEGTNNQRPCTVQFCWNNYTSFPAVVTSLSVTFEYFTSGGTPLRARANLTLQQYKDPTDQPRQNPTSGTPRPHRVHRVQPGETLDRIAARHYGEPTRWRAIAEANGIEDPLALRPGRLLAIPERP